jgi:hypothetical protein
MRNSRTSTHLDVKFNVTGVEFGKRVHDEGRELDLVLAGLLNVHVLRVGRVECPAERDGDDSAGRDVCLRI